MLKCVRSNSFQWKLLRFNCFKGNMIGVNLIDKTMKMMDGSGVLGMCLTLHVLAKSLGDHE